MSASYRQGCRSESSRSAPIAVRWPAMPLDYSLVVGGPDPHSVVPSACGTALGSSRRPSTDGRGASSFAPTVVFLATLESADAARKVKG
jgi:hypothetical protein